MDNMKSKLKIYCLTALFLTFIIAALRCISLFLFYSPELGYFNNSPVTTAMTALYTTSAIWLFSALILIPKTSIKAEFTPNSKAYQSGSAFTAVMFVFSFISTITPIGLDLKRLFTAIIILASALFFAISAIGNRKFDSLKAFSSLAVVLSLVVILALTYFDMNIAMNSPHKILGGLTAMIAMVFFLCETRIYLGKPLPRLHLASGLTVFMLGTSYGVSSIVYLLVASPNAFNSHPIMLGNIGYVGAIIGISIYAISRSFTFESADASTVDAPATDEVANTEEVTITEE